MRPNRRNGWISVKSGEPGRLIVDFPYSRERVDKIRTIPGRHWDPDKKQWTVPHSKDMTDRLSALFAGDEIRLAAELRDQSACPNTPLSSLGRLLWRVRQEIRARHLSPRTEEALQHMVTIGLNCNYTKKDIEDVAGAIRKVAELLPRS